MNEEALAQWGLLREKKKTLDFQSRMGKWQILNWLSKRMAL
jgi:hypothetical protein